MSSAEELKAKGNASFSSGNFEEAIEHFTAAIAVDPNNHVLYSNRSACQASLKQWSAALEDAKKTVELKPDWAKGYSRLGGAFYGSQQYKLAVDSYKQGLELDPNNVQLQNGLRDSEAALAGPGSGGGLFGPEFIAKLAMNPETREYLNQPDFMQLLNMLRTNPSNLGSALGDPRFQKAMQVGMGLSMSMPGDAPFADEATSAPEPAPAPKPTPAPAPEPEPELSEEEKSKQQAKAAALQEKEAGNAAYKKKDFDTAIKHYDAALELFDGDISFITNRAAVHFEKGDYDAAIKDCELAVERGREIRADFKMIAKALSRHGNCLVKQDKLHEAITYFNRALTEHRNPDTLRALQLAEKKLKQQEEDAYVDLARADEEKNAGNDAFKAAEYPKAVAHYTEALKRGPPGKWDEAYKVFSNRAACYTKLGALPEGEKDADKCIELKPDFAKGYSRKAHIQFFRKDHEKALETYEEGLKYDPENHELQDGKMRCMQMIARFMRGEASEEELKDRQARAMADPEIQSILTDPVVQQVLKEMQENPKAINQHMSNPMIAMKLQKLMRAGVIQMR